MIKIKEALVVEGRYDKARLASLVDGLIVETEGFGIFRDREKVNYLRTLARERGLILLLDSDGAGFLIRGRLSSLLPKEGVKHAYIPDIPGKERRKAAPSKEGKLGVEGMTLETLWAVLERAGCSPESGEAEKITKADFYDLGLTGGPNSSDRRRDLQRELDLPGRLSANGFLQAVNALYSREEFLRLASQYFNRRTEYGTDEGSAG